MAKTAAGPKPEPMIGGGLRMEASRKERAPKKRHISHISIKKAKGGVTVTHHHAYHPDLPHEEDKDHVFANDQFDSHLVPHLRRHLGMKKADDAAEKAEGESPAEEKAETPEEEAGENA